MSRRFIACKFREHDTRTYTYAYDGEEEFQPGDKVRVQDKSGEGWKTVIVAAVHNEEPAFACKSVIGRHIEDPEQKEIDL